VLRLDPPVLVAPPVDPPAPGPLAVEVPVPWPPAPDAEVSVEFEEHARHATSATEAAKENNRMAAAHAMHVPRTEAGLFGDSAR
jgi:hypothetical protein